MSIEPLIRWDNSYSRDLHGFYVAWQPARWPQAREIWFNGELDPELGLGASGWDPLRRAAILSGQEVPEGAAPLAQAYAGHQFGGFSPQLGDGRALLMGEVLDSRGARWDIALKGSGRTPFSRGGDGKAALGPMLREVIISQALHALGIPTTRALAVVATGEPVLRERVLRGAVLTRVASSHLRVGTFEYFAARGQQEELRRLLDYTVARHDPDLQGQPDRALGLLQRVVRRQAELVARWMAVGFVHGVMNTDNMTLSGQTIDFGPCAFLEAYDPQAVFSSIDRQGRYAFGRQPGIAQWNLARLAEALLPLIDEDPDAAVQRASEAVSGFAPCFERAMLGQWRLKLGLDAVPVSDTATAEEAAAAAQADMNLAQQWLGLLQAAQSDHTLAWRALCAAAQGRMDPLDAVLPPSETRQAWLQAWRARCAADGQDATSRSRRMRLANPSVIARNHLVEAALEAAQADDLQPMHTLLTSLAKPWEDLPDGHPHAQAAPLDFTKAYRTFCGT